MQAIGGVKGNETLDCGTIVGLYNKANLLAESAAKAGRPILTETPAHPSEGAIPGPYSSLALHRWRQLPEWLSSRPVAHAAAVHL